MQSSCINIDAITVELLTDLLETLLKYMADRQIKIQNLDHATIVMQLLNEMKHFFQNKSSTANYLYADPLTQTAVIMSNHKGSPR